MSRGFLCRCAILMAFIAGPGQLVAADEPAPIEVAERSLDAFYYAGDDMRARISMVLVNPQGKQRVRALTMLRKDFGTEGNQRYFIFFHAPADVKGTTFMVWKNPAKEDNRWIFIPSINLVRRIAASDKRSSFVGSDFTYEDISGRGLDDENHRLRGSEVLNGRPCFVLESTPRASADYVRRVSWIDKERWVPLREEYFDVRGEEVRVFTANEVEEIDGYWTVTKRTMANIQTGHRTEVTFENVAYNVGFKDGLFTERYLRQPPRKWIR
ncbi:MAG: outer membrane lipoprotein-sorting protein [Candidatus Krumholzibacteriia bacterium]